MEGEYLLVSRSRCSTPNRCSSSTTAKPRSLKAVEAVDSTACVATRISTFYVRHDNDTVGRAQGTETKDRDRDRDRQRQRQTEAETCEVISSALSFPRKVGPTMKRGDGIGQEAWQQIESNSSSSSGIRAFGS